MQTSQGAGKGCPWLPYYYREADGDYTPPRRDVGGGDEGVCSRTETQVVPSGGWVPARGCVMVTDPQRVHFSVPVSDRL